MDHYVGLIIWAGRMNACFTFAYLGILVMFCGKQIGKHKTGQLDVASVTCKRPVHTQLF